MGVSSIKYLNQIASFLKVQPGKIALNDDILPTRVVDKTSISGHLNIILELIKEANSNLDGLNHLEKAEVNQWVEYCVVYILQSEGGNPYQLLKELNTVLATKTYLVSHKLSIADIFLYYVLQSVMENLSIVDKEKYINLSRWFDNLQQDASIRQSNKHVQFSTLYLANVAPAKH